MAYAVLGRVGLKKQSFERAKAWVEELQVRGSPDVVIALAGNKCVRPIRASLFLFDLL